MVVRKLKQLNLRFIPARLGGAGKALYKCLLTLHVTLDLNDTGIQMVKNWRVSYKALLLNLQH